MTHLSIDFNQKNNAYSAICKRLERCAIANQKLSEIEDKQDLLVIKWCQKLPFVLAIVWHLVQLCFLAMNNMKSLEAIY